jgi:hypothetical protein
MSVTDFKRGYSVRLGSGQASTQFDSLQVISRYIIFFLNTFIFGRPNKNDFQIILQIYIYFYFITVIFYFSFYA